MATLDPREFAFWMEHRLLLRNQVSDVAMRVMLAGVQNGAVTMPRGFEVLVDWDVVNEDALAWLNRYTFDLVGGITEVSRRQTIRIIDDWIREGAPLSSLEARLATVFGPARAGRIATTEVTRLYAQGNLAAWSSTGVVSGKMWLTRANAGVCPICQPLHMQIVQLDGEFHHHNPTLQAKVVQSIGTGRFSSPPAHVNCYCWLQPFVSEDLLREQIRAGLTAAGRLMDYYGVSTAGACYEAAREAWREWKAVTVNG